ncbi:uncharacterized protein LOC116120459 [Pistacia vera]|uniref:uncharacterized protein LOC116120459 n=1 Tax=Pistacia vera TaxID=55513 RepID=UPI001263A177|nr:uncharacterized protein LOC116120459 [Pistacia vera]
MTSLNSLSFFYFSPLKSLPKFISPRLSFPTRRLSRRPKRTLFNPLSNNDKNTKPFIKPSADFENINLVLDFHQISVLSSSSKSRLQHILSSAEEAYHDLRTIITLDDNGRLFVSCRKSSLQLLGGLLLSGFVLVFFFRFLVRLGLGVRDRFGVSKPRVVVRRDRSLGGKEVVVGTEEDVRRGFNKPLKNPLAPGRVDDYGVSGRVRKGFQVRKEEKLPQWWPAIVAAEQTLVVDKEEYQREANRLIRAIIDHRTSGQDIMEDEIIQLRRLCRTSGVRVSIDTINTRDSLYRTSVDFVLNVCSRELGEPTSVYIYGEDARQFIAGLADNIGLENTRAARMVSAAVAARTRSCFLQAWALEMQGNHFEAVSELSKICRVLCIFPPKESSPEMEMVARGLEKLLKVEQREYLMNMLVGVCSEESQRTAAEALGLVLSPEGYGEQHEN